jgi:hypothetical protein
VAKAFACALLTLAGRRVGVNIICRLIEWEASGVQIDEAGCFRCAVDHEDAHEIWFKLYGCHVHANDPNQPGRYI